jgi:Berberine and berberine like
MICPSGSYLIGGVYYGQQRCWLARFSSDATFSTTRIEAVYSNDQGAPPVKTSYLDNFERLAAVKQKFDPASLFRVNHNVRSSVDFGLAALHDIPAAVSLNNVVPCPALS